MMAGPVAAMATLLPTNRPAPMMPPMVSSRRAAAGANGSVHYGPSQRS